ncbi:hypothetical protein ACQEU3_37610 [Spirillospora sp. CA-253888]
MVQQLAELATWMRDASPGGWAADEVRTLLQGRGWELDGTGVRTGLPAGDARLVSAGRRDEASTVGLVVPLGTAADSSVLAQTTHFRRVAEEVVGVLGPAAILGSHGDVGPFYEAVGPAWGSPYLRWRYHGGEGHSVELRAGRQGPELALMATAPLENWFWKTEWGVFPAPTGYLGIRNTDPSLAGFGWPGGCRAEDWKGFEEALASWLGALAAEKHALGIRFSPFFFGGGTAFLHLDVGRDQVRASAFIQNSVDAAALGWTRAPDDDCPFDDRTEWEVTSGGVGETDGAALARAIVAACRASGGTTPTEFLTIGGEGTDATTAAGDRYDLTFYQLGLPVG